MSYFKKIKTFFLTAICLPFSLFFWYICFGLTPLFGAGIFLFQYGCNQLGFRDLSSYFVEKNPDYGKRIWDGDYNETKNIYNSSGDVVGRMRPEKQYQVIHIR